MANISRVMLQTLTKSYIVCMISILLAVISPDENALTIIFEFIAIYGSIITIYIFIFYLITLLLASIFKRK